MGTVTLEHYATMRAEMDAGTLRDQVLAAERVSADEWTVIQREWLEKMGAEIERGRFELTNRYTAAFLARQRQLDASARPLPSQDLAQVSVEAKPPPPAPTTVVPLRAELPSFALSPSPSPSPAPIVAPPPLPFATSPAPRERVPTADFGRTFDGTMSPLAAAPLPFAAAAARAPAPAPKRVINPAISGTMDGATQSPRAVLPFQKDAKPSLPEPSPSPPAPAAKKKAYEKYGSTMAVDTALLAAALPFQGKPVTPGAPGPGPGPAPVAPPPQARTNDALTFEQYVSLCAELAFAPPRADEILARYHMSRQAKADLDAQYKQRFAQDRELEKRWHEAYRVYFAFLTGRR